MIASILAGVGIGELGTHGRRLPALLLIAGGGTLMVLGDRLREIELRVLAAAPPGEDADRGAISVEIYNKVAPRLLRTGITICFSLIVAAGVLLGIAQKQKGPNSARLPSPLTLSDAHFRATGLSVGVGCTDPCVYSARAKVLIDDNVAGAQESFGKTMPGTPGLINFHFSRRLTKRLRQAERDGHSLSVILIVTGSPSSEHAAFRQILYER